MKRIPRKPEPFFGPDDYVVPGDESRHNALIAKWEQEFAILPLARRIAYHIFGF